MSDNSEASTSHTGSSDAQTTRNRMERVQKMKEARRRRERMPAYEGVAESSAAASSRSAGSSTSRSAGPSTSSSAGPSGSSSLRVSADRKAMRRARRATRDARNSGVSKKAMKEKGYQALAGGIFISHKVRKPAADDKPAESLPTAPSTPVATAPNSPVARAAKLPQAALDAEALFARMEAAKARRSMSPSSTAREQPASDVAPQSSNGRAPQSDTASSAEWAESLLLRTSSVGDATLSSSLLPPPLVQSTREHRDIQAIAGVQEHMNGRDTAANTFPMPTPPPAPRMPTLPLQTEFPPASVTVHPQATTSVLPTIVITAADEDSTMAYASQPMTTMTSPSVWSGHSNLSHTGVVSPDVDSPMQNTSPPPASLPRPVAPRTKDRTGHASLALRHGRSAGKKARESCAPYTLAKQSRLPSVNSMWPGRNGGQGMPRSSPVLPSPKVSLHRKLRRMQRAMRRKEARRGVPLLGRRKGRRILARVSQRPEWWQAGSALALNGVPYSVLEVMRRGVDVMAVDDEDSDMVDAVEARVEDGGDAVPLRTPSPVKPVPDPAAHEVTDAPTSTSKPEPSTLKGSKPEVTKPEVNKPEVGKPEVSKPEVSKPATSTPEVSAPEVSQPEASTSKLPVQASSQEDVRGPKAAPLPYPITKVSPSPATSQPSNGSVAAAQPRKSIAGESATPPVGAAPKNQGGPNPEVVRPAGQQPAITSTAESKGPTMPALARATPLGTRKAVVYMRAVPPVWGPGAVSMVWAPQMAAKDVENSQQKADAETTASPVLDAKKAREAPWAAQTGLSSVGPAKAVKSTLHSQRPPAYGSWFAPRQPLFTPGASSSKVRLPTPPQPPPKKTFYDFLAAMPPAQPLCALTPRRLASVRGSGAGHAGGPLRFVMKPAHWQLRNSPSPSQSPKPSRGIAPPHVHQVYTYTAVNPEALHESRTRRELETMTMPGGVYDLDSVDAYSVDEEDDADEEYVAPGRGATGGEDSDSDGVDEDDEDDEDDSSSDSESGLSDTDSLMAELILASLGDFDPEPGEPSVVASVVVHVAGTASFLAGTAGFLAGTAVRTVVRGVKSISGWWKG